MEVGQAVIDRLVANGIDMLFGIPGKQTLPLNEAIASRDDVEFVVARHETAVSHQAWGYAETSGDAAGTVVVPGPGDMNAMNGLKNALNDCTPLVHIAVETSPEIRGGDGIHETPPGTYDTVVKDNRLVEQPAGTLVELEQAIATARTPPKGPVVLAGGGVRAAEASAELRAVADRLNAPIVTTYKGKGTVPDGHDLVAGSLSGSAPPELLASLAGADALLAVGTDLDAVATRSWSVDLPEGAYGWEHAPLEFTTIAGGMGVETMDAAQPAEIRERIAAALTTERPTLVEIPTDPAEPQASTWLSKRDDRNDY